MCHSLFPAHLELGLEKLAKRVPELLRDMDTWSKAAVLDGASAEQAKSTRMRGPVGEELVPQREEGEAAV